MFVVVTLVLSSESLRTVGDVAADVCDGGNLQWDSAGGKRVITTGGSGELFGCGDELFERAPRCAGAVVEGEVGDAVLLAQCVDAFSGLLD
jgi:hypothetical protein